MTTFMTIFCAETTHSDEYRPQSITNRSAGGGRK